jgi:hypothetical protein
MGRGRQPSSAGTACEADGITLKALADQPFILATGGCVVNGKSLMEKAGCNSLISA